MQVEPGTCSVRNRNSTRRIRDRWSQGLIEAGVARDRLRKGAGSLSDKTADVVDIVYVNTIT